MVQIKAWIKLPTKSEFVQRAIFLFASHHSIMDSGYWVDQITQIRHIICLKTIGMHHSTIKKCIYCEFTQKQTARILRMCQTERASKIVYLVHVFLI